MKLITIQIRVEDSVDADVLATQIEHDLDEDWGTDFDGMELLFEEAAE